MTEEVCDRLFLAIKSGDTKLVQEIMKHGDTHKLESNWTASDPPLVLASKVGHNVEMLAALMRLPSEQLSSGSYEEVIQQYHAQYTPGWDVNARTATGEGALHCVCSNWEASTIHEALVLLISAGCDPCQCDNLRRQLPLHLLARRLGSGKKSGTPHKVSTPLLLALQILTQRCDVNSRDHRNRTCLHVLTSSHCTDPRPYLLLLRRGADIGIQNDRGETPLLEALECGALNAAELLIKQSLIASPYEFICDNKPDITEINNSKNECEINEENKSEINGKNEIKVQINGINISEINNEINNKVNSKNQPGEIIKINGTDDEKLIELHIFEQDQVDIRYESHEKPGITVEERRKGMVCSSIEAKEIRDVSTDIINKTQNLILGEESSDWLNKSTLYGETALHVAARKDLASIVALMLQVSKHPNFTGARDLNGDTALHLAASRGHLEIVEMLLACDEIDLNARNRKGLAPLHVAVESGFIHVVKILLESPLCDVAARTGDERRSSPFDLAQHEYRRRSQPEMSIILMREAERRKLALR